MSYTAAFEPKVVRTYPRNLAHEIPNNAVIKVDFNTDLDRDDINPYVVVTDQLGNRIEGQITYDERTISFVPTTPYAVSQSIRVTLIGDDLSGSNRGIRSVLGERMKGDFHFSFSIVAIPQLPAPQLKFPSNQSIIDRDPVFDWAPVTGAEYYQIQVSRSNTMNPVLWPKNPDEHRVYDASIPVNPNEKFADGIYYWRVRAFSVAAGEGTWSDLALFNKDTLVEGTVSPEDAPTDFPVFDEEPGIESFEILEVFPEESFSNVATNLKTLYVRVLGMVTREEAQNAFEIYGERVDGDDSDPTLVHGEVTGQIDVINEGDTTLITFTFDPLPEVKV